jgi:hypothetical protein
MLRLREGGSVTTRWVVAVRPIDRPTRPYKYVAGDRLTLDRAEATHLTTLDRALVLASQVRILAGGAYLVEVVEIALREPGEGQNLLSTPKPAPTDWSL